MNTDDRFTAFDDGNAMMMNLGHKVGYVLGAYWEAGWAIRRQRRVGAIRAMQNRKLRRLVQYSFDHVKYYREAFQRAGITPDLIQTVDDLPRLPILTKHELRDRLWDFLPHNLPACRVTRTSGSTGTPVCIFADWHSRQMNTAATIRYLRGAGVPLWGRPILAVLKTKDRLYRAPHWVIAQGFHRKYYVSPYVVSPQDLEDARRLVMRLRRPILVGIPSALNALTSGVRQGIFPPFAPGVILTGGEMLLPRVRELIESTFGMTVTDMYACNETRDIAWQCRMAGAYHINADNVIVEILQGDKPAPPGHTGEVVLTDLNRRVMPIIRYKNGDLARLTDASCPCGCQLPLLAEIVGRTGENIVLPDGTSVLWNHLKSQMTHPHIRQFQLVQDRRGDLVIRYVPEEGADTARLHDLLYRRFRAMVGDAIQIRIGKVTSIAPAATGKMGLVVSHYRPSGDTSAGVNSGPAESGPCHGLPELPHVHEPPSSAAQSEEPPWIPPSQ